MKGLRRTVRLWITTQGLLQALQFVEWEQCRKKKKNPEHYKTAGVEDTLVLNDNNRLELLEA